MKRTITSVLRGTLQGRIWWPQDICQKEVTVDLNRERDRYAPHERAGCLRHILCGVTADGDFQGASLTDDSFIEVTLERREGNKLIRKTRYVDLTELPSMADLITEREF